MRKVGKITDNIKKILKTVGIAVLITMLSLLSGSIAHVDTDSFWKRKGSEHKA